MIPLFCLLAISILGFLGFASYLIVKFVFSNIKTKKSNDIEPELIRNIDLAIEKDLQAQLKINSFKIKDKASIPINDEENQEGIPYPKYTF